MDFQPTLFSGILYISRKKMASFTKVMLWTYHLWCMHLEVPLSCLNFLSLELVFTRELALLCDSVSGQARCLYRTHLMTQYSLSLFSVQLR